MISLQSVPISIPAGITSMVGCHSSPTESCSAGTMDAYTLIKVFEIKAGIHTSLGIVRIKGEPTYKKARLEIKDDDLYHDLFEFVVANDFVLSTKQEEKWTKESDIVCIRGTTSSSSNRLSSKESCTWPLKSVLKEQNNQRNQNCESIPNSEDLPLVPQRIVRVYLILKICP